MLLTCIAPGIDVSNGDMINWKIELHYNIVGNWDKITSLLQTGITVKFSVKA